MSKIKDKIGETRGMNNGLKAQINNPPPAPPTRMGRAELANRMHQLGYQLDAKTLAKVFYQYTNTVATHMDNDMVINVIMCELDRGLYNKTAVGSGDAD